VIDRIDHFSSQLVKNVKAAAKKKKQREEREDLDSSRNAVSYNMCAFISLRKIRYVYAMVAWITKSAVSHVTAR
jgi:hypothetical protein